MTHPCDQRSNAARPANNVISLAYTPEIIERKRAQRLARAAWREAQDPGHRFVAGMGVCERHKGLCLCKPDGFGTQRVAGPTLHKHPAMIALAHVLARAAARAAMLGTGDAAAHVPPAAPAAADPKPDTGSVTTGADLSTPRRTFDPERVIAPPVRNCDDHGDAHGHGTDDADDFGDVSF